MEVAVPNSFATGHTLSKFKIKFSHLCARQLGSSQLKYQKKRHHFLNTPSDLCDCRCSPKESLHFFLRCNQCIACRQKLIEVQTILRRYDDNKKILLATLRFIRWVWTGSTFIFLCLLLCHPPPLPPPPPPPPPPRPFFILYVRDCHSCVKCKHWGLIIVFVFPVHLVLFSMCNLT